MTNRCPACGSAVDGDVCDWRCAEEMDRRVKWAGKEPCQDCLERHLKQSSWEVEPALDGEDVCEEHRDQRNEAAYESYLQDFYGGSR